MDMEVFLQKEGIFPGVHKIGAAISGPRIEDKNFTDTRIFLTVADSHDHNTGAASGPFLKTHTPVFLEKSHMLCISLDWEGVGRDPTRLWPEGALVSLLSVRNLQGRFFLQGQFLAVWTLVMKLPNSDLIFAVDFGLDFPQFFLQKEAQKNYKIKRTKLTRKFVRRILLGFLQL